MNSLDIFTDFNKGCLTTKMELLTHYLSISGAKMSGRSFLSVRNLTLSKIVSFLKSKGVGKRVFALKRAGDMLKDNVKAQMVIRCQEDC